MVFACILYAIQWLTCIIAIYSIRHKKYSGEEPSFTLLRPFCGADYGSNYNVFSANLLTYNNINFLYCVESDSDPCVGIIKACVNVSDTGKTKILVGIDENLSNPKLSNLSKGVKFLESEYIAMADSNIELYPDYIQQALNTFSQSDKIAVVSAPPYAIEAKTFWASIEAVTLNTMQLRWQYVANFFGYGFAQGKNLIMKTEFLHLFGGMKGLDREPAEDAAITKEARKLNMRVALMPPTKLLLGPRSFKDYWDRQVRWARLRRKTFLPQYIPEILTGILPLLVYFIYAKVAFAAMLGLIFLFYLPEMFLAVFLKADVYTFYFLQCLFRDFMYAAIWIMGWGNTIKWRGKKI